mmetsp:Transcript_24920/g.49602  ORF Transcript_24920/g.49602 Transcript_24920/m.49602 type:complete len:205 (-) Transcript_24920:551-1165(-)
MLLGALLSSSSFSCTPATAFSVGDSSDHEREDNTSCEGATNNGYERHFAAAIAPSRTPVDPLSTITPSTTPAAAAIIKPWCCAAVPLVTAFIEPSAAARLVVDGIVKAEIATVSFHASNARRAINAFRFPRISIAIEAPAVLAVVSVIAGRRRCSYLHLVAGNICRNNVGSRRDNYVNTIRIKLGPGSIVRGVPIPAQHCRTGG